MALKTLSYKTDSDVVKNEGRGRISRDEGILASGSGILRPGKVLGRITASTKLVPLAPAASDGSQNAAAILLENVDARCFLSRTRVASARLAARLRSLSE